jgi:ferredoxin
MTEDGKIDVKKEFHGVEITDDALQAKVREATEACPATAIVIEE